MKKVRQAAQAIAVLAALAVAASGGPAAAATPAAPEPVVPAAPTTADQIYAAARPKLLQIRTLVAAANRQSLIGSGFLVSADGLAITNYHVVSQFALEPATYRLEYIAADGSRGKLSLLAIDLADDLAVVRLDRQGEPAFAFNQRALTGGLAKGERLYSMGNPLDLGFTIVEGTYNGLVERSYNDRIHFSGALNPGMSGGPAVTADGRVVGINVARQLGSELVSFLVPARFAAALLQRAERGSPPPPGEFRAEIGRQLAAWQAGFFQAVAGQGFRPTPIGPYEAAESAAPWFTCWAQTNADAIPPPRATVNTTNCYSETRLFVAADLNTGTISLQHSFYRSVDLNPFQFAAYLSQQSPLAGFAGWSQKWYTPERCHEDFLAAGGGAHPPLRVVWCARAYRAFAGLYDVSLTAVTQDKGREALMSRLSLQGIAYDNAVALARRFLEAVQWTK